MRHRCRDERGVASVVVLALILALMAVAWGAGCVVAAIMAHRSAQNAADLAALAGAEDLAHAGDGCARAGEVALANRARLISCAVEGSVVSVEVAAAVSFGVTGEMHARARAGP